MKYYVCLYIQKLSDSDVSYVIAALRSFFR